MSLVMQLVSVCLCLSEHVLTDSPELLLKGNTESIHHNVSLLLPLLLLLQLMQKKKTVLQDPLRQMSKASPACNGFNTCIG